MCVVISLISFNQEEVSSLFCFLQHWEFWCHCCVGCPLIWICCFIVSAWLVEVKHFYTKITELNFSFFSYLKALSWKQFTCALLKVMSSLWILMFSERAPCISFLVFASLIRMSVPWRKGCSVFCLLLYPWYGGQCLAHSRNLKINHFWIDFWWNKISWL